jgi:DNA-binding LytR/AlgR family response regulator
MKVLIIEDEPLAAKRLQSMLDQIDPKIQVLAVVDSIAESVEWLDENTPPDLIFMDIMLADGQSFEIFEQIEIHVPVIFTTAYDEFAIRAFKVNSIDYLLKPIGAEMLSAALKKYALINPSSEIFRQTIKSLLNAVANNLPPEYKNRFLVKTGDKFIPVTIADIAYFSFSDRLTFLTTTANKRFMLGSTLDDLEAVVDPKVFFRLNRKYIVSFPAINTVHNYFNGKLKTFVFPEIIEGIIVSKEKAQLFKNWLDR